MIEQIKKQIPHRKLISQAAYKDVDTGRLQIVEVRDVDGVVRKEERPIIERVFIEAQYADELHDVDVWVVKDGDESHEFTSLSAAEFYLKGKK